jgi:TolA-binding protein
MIPAPPLIRHPLIRHPLIRIRQHLITAAQEVRRILAKTRVTWVTGLPKTRAITGKTPIRTATDRTHRAKITRLVVPSQNHPNQNIPTQNRPIQDTPTQRRPVQKTMVQGITVQKITVQKITVQKTTVQSRGTHGTDQGRADEASRFAAIIVFLGFALLGGPRAWASSEEALAHFTQGQAAFEAEDFSKARAYFEQALAAGMEGPAVQYNIGAAAYLGGDLPRAERAFLEVARTPAMAALAHYNLGLVALQRHDEREARDWFEQTTQDVPDERLAALALQRLEELPESRAPGFFSYYTRGGAGYDDNISLRSGSVESSATGDEDSYGELIFGGSYSFGAWRVDTAAAMLHYTHLDDFSQTAFSLGGARGFRLDNWYFELGAYGSQYSLGGEVFERNVAVGAQATRAFYNGSRLSAQLRASSVEGKGAFPGLTGDRTEAGLYYDLRWRSWNFLAHTRAEINDSEDPIFASRWLQLGAEARYAWSPTWGFMAITALRRTTHPAQSETLSGWDDNRATIQVGTTRSLWKQAQLFVRFEHERNDSPVAGYDYVRNWVAASVEYWR